MLPSVAKLQAKGKTVLVRVDYNIPMQKTVTGEKIIDSRRIFASLPTIKLLQKNGAKVVLIAHREEPNDSLAPVAVYLKKKIKNVHFFSNNIKTEDVKALIDALPPKSVVLLENIRRYEGEKKNDPPFARRLAALADAYVDEAFSVAHRAHASIVGVVKLLPHYAGLNFESEVAALSIPMMHPLFFILGGAKFETKVPLIEKFLKLADHVFVAGAIANLFLKVAGFPVGKSVVDDGETNGINSAIKTFLNNEKLLLPFDVIVQHGKKAVVCSIDEVAAGDTIVDIGPETTALVCEKIKKSKLVIWNGPTGWYEKGFTKQTAQIAKAIQKSKAHAIIGGGDTGAVIEKVLKKHSKRIFISTAGGAAIDFLAKGTLPGIEALEA